MAANSRVTIKDVALEAEAGVSIGTVSNVNPRRDILQKIKAWA